MHRRLLGVLLLAASLQAGVEAARLLGSSKCTWGPSYWCKGLPESAKCGATSHCIDTLWSTNPYPTDDDEVCKICKEMVKEARDQLESNETMVRAASNTHDSFTATDTVEFDCTIFFATYK